MFLTLCTWMTSRLVFGFTMWLTDDEPARLSFRLDLLTLYTPWSSADLQPLCKRTPTCFVSSLPVLYLYRGLKINCLFNVRTEHSSHSAAVCHGYKDESIAGHRLVSKTRKSLRICILIICQMYRTIFSVIVNVKVTGNAKENAFRVTVTVTVKQPLMSDDSSNTRNAGATKWGKKR
jgi:hypothetical protein